MSLELMHSTYRKDKGQLCPPLSLLFESALGKRYSPVWFGTTTNARKTNNTTTNKRERMSDLDVLLYPPPSLFHFADVSDMSKSGGGFFPIPHFPIHLSPFWRGGKACGEAKIARGRHLAASPFKAVKCVPYIVRKPVVHAGRTL